MSLVEIAPNVSKEDKLNQILDYMNELKKAFADVVQEFEDEDAEEETIDLLTGALDALEDAHDVVLDLVEDLDKENCQ